MKIKLVFIILLLSISELAWADSAQRDVKKGNEFYAKGRFDESLVNYNDALGKLPDSDIINFDIGSACYKKEDYNKAIEAFTKVFATEKSDLEAKANYNIGNCKYKQGKLKENTDLGKTIELYRQALDYYKQALELDDKFKEAKYNHEFVSKKMKALLDKYKQQQDQQQQNQQQQQQNKQEEDKNQQQQQAQQEQQDKQDQNQQAQQAQQKQQQQAKQDQDKNQQQDKAQQQQQQQGQVGKEEDKEKDKDKPEEKAAKLEEANKDQQQESGQEKKQPAQEQEENKEMTKEQARLLLEGSRDEEVSGTLDDRNRRNYEVEVDKNW